jgi:hypothetical protein
VANQPEEFQILLYPQDTYDESRHVNVTLHVKFVPNYPDQMPEWYFKDSKGLSKQMLDELHHMIREKVGRCSMSLPSFFFANASIQISYYIMCSR